MSASDAIPVLPAQHSISDLDIDTEQLSASEFVSRIQSVYPELDAAGLRLNYDLLTEFKRLRAFIQSKVGHLR